MLKVDENCKSRSIWLKSRVHCVPAQNFTARRPSRERKFTASTEMSGTMKRGAGGSGVEGGGEDMEGLMLTKKNKGVCDVPGCGKVARDATGKCLDHGGRRCAEPGCDRAAQDSTGKCATHGGARKCEEGGCTKVKKHQAPAAQRVSMTAEEPQ